MTSTDPALDQLRADATRTWSPASADALLRHLVPDPTQLLTKDHLDLRLAAEFAAFRTELRTELARYDSRFAQVESRFAQVESRFDLVDSQFTIVRTEIAASADRLQVALHRDMISQTKWVVGALLSGIFAFGSLLVAVAAVIG